MPSNLTLHESVFVKARNGSNDIILDIRTINNKQGIFHECKEPEMTSTMYRHDKSTKQTKQCITSNSVVDGKTRMHKQNPQLI